MFRKTNTKLCSDVQGQRYNNDPDGRKLQKIKALHPSPFDMCYNGCLLVISPRISECYIHRV